MCSSRRLTYVARDAAAAALEAGHPEMAVEWLEQWRSIVWNQFLQLRTPVDELFVEHSELADQFQHISRLLESLTSYHTDDLVSGTQSLEEEVQRHHDFVLRRENLLVEIQSLPGSERFLFRKTIEQLAVFESAGPVIYLNVSKQRCDAFIIKAGSNSVVPVPLPDISYHDLQVLHCLLAKRNYLRISRNDISALISSEDNPVSQYSLDVLLMENEIECNDREGAPDPEEIEEYSLDDRFRRILGLLWKRVVYPVLVSLGLLVR